MLQQLLVALLVFVAFAFSVWRLMPERRRLGLLPRLARWAERHAALAASLPLALKPQVARSAGVGCYCCAAKHHQARQKESHEQGLADQERVLITLIRLGDTQEQKEQTQKDDDVMGRHDDAPEQH
jgi:hypothetical protein